MFKLNKQAMDHSVDLCYEDTGVRHCFVQPWTSVTQRHEGKTKNQNS